MSERSTVVGLLMKRTGLLTASLVVLLLILTACGDSSGSLTLVQEYAPRIGYLAPDFELKDYLGNSFKLSDFKGKPVLINFWATWCPPCRAEMPEIEAAYHKYQKDGLVVLGINNRESDSTVKKYVEDGGFHWPMPMDYEGSVIGIYGVAAYPTSFFIDKQGFIVATQIGGMDKKGLEDRLFKILGNS